MYPLACPRSLSLPAFLSFPPPSSGQHSWLLDSCLPTFPAMIRGPHCPAHALKGLGKMETLDFPAHRSAWLLVMRRDPEGDLSVISRAGEEGESTHGTKWDKASCSQPSSGQERLHWPRWNRGMKSRVPTPRGLPDLEFCLAAPSTKDLTHSNETISGCRLAVPPSLPRRESVSRSYQPPKSSAISSLPPSQSPELDSQRSERHLVREETLRRREERS